MRFATLSAVTLACLLAGCPGKSPTTPTPKKVTTASTPAADLAKQATLSGTVVAGSGIVAQGAGNIVAQGGGNIVAQGGGNIVAQGAGNYRLAGLGEQALANTAVFLFDGAGKPMGHTTTDAKGVYSFKVPTGHGFQVVAAGNQDGKLAKLCTVAMADGTKADISTATTCVALECMKQADGKLKGWDATKFSALVTTCNKWLADKDALDLTSDATILGEVEALGGTPFQDAMKTFSTAMTQVSGDGFASLDGGLAKLIDASGGLADAGASAAASAGQDAQDAACSVKTSLGLPCN